MTATIRIGTSGFSYEHWRGVFYPEQLPRPQWLNYYCARFDTLELDNPFYRLPSRATVRDWAVRAPAGFIYSVKASRYITHLKKLNDVVEPLARMLEHYRLLGDKLGPILFQFPPNWRRNTPRLQSLLDRLPSSLAFAFEFRHGSWLHEETYAALAAAGAALCVADSPSYPRSVRITAPFTFIRMHGGTVLYGSEYSDEELQQWAARISGFAESGTDVFVYFNNDADGFAITNARRLKELLGDRLL